MEFHPTLDNFFQEHGRLEREAFLSAFPAPFLTFDMLALTPDNFDEYAASTRAQEATVVSSNLDVELARIIVAPIAKSDRNRGTDFITLGRSPENDLVIPHESVSKVHAVLEDNPALKTFTIRDVSSTYGTRVNGRRAEPEEKVPLRDDYEIIFAKSVPAVFRTSASFYEFLLALSPDPS